MAGFAGARCFLGAVTAAGFAAVRVCVPAEAGSVGFGSFTPWVRAEIARAARLSGCASCFGTGYMRCTEPSCEYVYWLPYTSWSTR